jgi:hypothetical protein
MGELRTGPSAIAKEKYLLLHDLISWSSRIVANEWYGDKVLHERGPRRITKIIIDDDMSKGSSKHYPCTAPLLQTVKPLEKSGGLLLQRKCLERSRFRSLL